MTRGQPVRIRDIHDVREFAARALNDALRRFGATLREQEWEDALQELCGVVVWLDRRYDPEKGVAFSTYAYRILRLRVVDWYRSRFEQSRGGRRVELLSLDLDADPGGTGGLDSHLASRAGDPAESRAPDLVRALTDRRGTAERLDPDPRERAARRAARRDRSPARTEGDVMAPNPATVAVVVKVDTAEFEEALKRGVAQAELRIRDIAREEAERQVASLLADMLGNLEGDEHAAFRSAIAPWLVKIGGRS